MSDNTDALGEQLYRAYRDAKPIDPTSPPSKLTIEEGYAAQEAFLERQLSDYPRLLTELRDRNPDEFDLRTVEKAYYQQYRDTYDVGRW